MKIISTIFLLLLLGCSSQKQNDYLEFNTLDEAISYANKSENLPIYFYILNGSTVTKDSMSHFISQPKKRKLKEVIIVKGVSEAKTLDGEVGTALIVTSR